MNSQNLFQTSNDKKDPSQINKGSPIEFTLSYDQYIILQHFLPKKYSLIQYKSTKRTSGGSALKFAQDDVIHSNINIQAQNFSKVSGNYDNTQQNEGRSKRPRPKKVDRFLQNQLPQKSSKRNNSQRFSLNLDEQMTQCYNILNLLKKHKSAYPFLVPVDPKLDGAYNYLDIIKQPMDLSTVQNNLKNGEYQTAGQFHGDINKIWLNSYAYNQKSSPLYKLTIDVQKYYKNICNNEGISKKTKIQQKGRNKDIKNSKRQTYQKNSQKQSQMKQNDRKSNSIGGGNQNGYDDSDQFLE